MFPGVLWSDSENMDVWVELIRNGWMGYWTRDLCTETKKSPFYWFIQGICDSRNANKHLIIHILLLYLVG